jgi:glycosyltransferase involved in cell wall biosynthesis
VAQAPLEARLSLLERLALPSFLRAAPRPRPTLSVCVVAQDEAAHLEELLANVRGLADEVVVVDGGSRDGTREAARAGGARLVEHPWPGHWGAQKNVAFDAARGDWILNLDCDERVGERLAARIPELISSRRRGFYRLPMYWVIEEAPRLRYLRSPDHYPCHVPRLFRNLPAHRYVTGDGLCHPTYPKEVRRRMTKVRGAHLFHLLLARTPRAALEARMARYEAQDPRARATNERYYPYWRIPHTVLDCEERIAGARP